jgi:outer membrane protein assembly factor BamA
MTGAASLVLLLTLQQPAPAATPPVDIPDVVRHLLGRPPPPERDDDTRQSILPTIGASPAAGVSAGVLLSRQGRSREAGSRVSLLTIGASYSTRHRAILTTRIDRHLRHDTWHLVGDWRAYAFTERTYGLGSDTTSGTSVDVPLDWGRAYTTLYRRVAGHLAIGGGYHFDARKAHDLGDDAPVDSQVSFASGVSLDIEHDTRNTAVNPAHGWFARASVTWFTRALGSTQSWRELQSEARAYRRLPVSRRHILAVWGLAWLTLDGEPDYFNLPSIGWDLYGRTGRGYAAGRYRGRGWLYGEAEYRVDVLRSGLIGAVVFVNTSTLSDTQDHYGRWLPAGGTGLRVKLDKVHGSNLAIDYGWGVDGSRGAFLALNEAF